MPTILKLIARNASQAPATVRWPGSVPVPAGYRGPVRLEPARCLACGLCARVCVSGAITGEHGGAAYFWGYDPGRCAFCARCADHCPGGALAMDGEPAAAYTRPGELAVGARVPFPPCPACGTPTRPATEALVRTAFDRVTDELRALVRLCERCRRRRLQGEVAAAVGVTVGEGGARSRGEGGR